MLGFLQIFAKHNNYNIKKEDLNMDIRVRRHIDSYENLILHAPHENEHMRDKRYTAYPVNIPRYNYTTRTETKNHENSTNIFNQTWNYIFNKTKRYFSGSSVQNNRTSLTGYKYDYLRSYPYSYPPGYGPKNAGKAAGYATTPGYKDNAPYFYNYQNPNGRNFGGYYGVNGLTDTNNITNQNLTYPSGYMPYPGNNRPNNTRYSSNYTNINNIPGYNYSQPIPGYNPVTYTPYSAGYNPYNPGNYNIPDYNNQHNPISKNNVSNYNIPGSNPDNSSVPLPKYPVTPVTNPLGITTSTERVMACVVCNIPCPAFFQRFGNLCVKKNYDEDY